MQCPCKSLDCICGRKCMNPRDRCPCSGCLEPKYRTCLTCELALRCAYPDDLEEWPNDVCICENQTTGAQSETPPFHNAQNKNRNTEVHEVQDNLTVSSNLLETVPILTTETSNLSDVTRVTEPSRWNTFDCGNKNERKALAGKSTVSIEIDKFHTHKDNRRNTGIDLAEDTIETKRNRKSVFIDGQSGYSLENAPGSTLAVDICLDASKQAKDMNTSSPILSWYVPNFKKYRLNPRQNLRNNEEESFSCNPEEQSSDSNTGSERRSVASQNYQNTDMHDVHKRTASMIHRLKIDFYKNFASQYPITPKVVSENISFFKNQIEILRSLFLEFQLSLASVPDEPLILESNTFSEGALCFSSLKQTVSRYSISRCSLPEDFLGFSLLRQEFSCFTLSLTLPQRKVSRFTVSDEFCFSYPPPEVLRQEGVPSSSSLQEGVPSSSSLQEGVPSSSSLQEGVPSSSSLQEGVPSSSSLQESVPSSPSLQERVSSDFSLNEDVVSVSSLNEKISFSTTTDEEIPYITSSDEEMPSAPFPDDRIFLESSSIETVHSFASQLDISLTCLPSCDYPRDSFIEEENTGLPQQEDTRLFVSQQVDPNLYIPQNTDPCYYVPPNADPHYYVSQNTDPRCSISQNTDPLYVPQGTDPVYYVPQATDPVYYVPQATDPVYFVPQGTDPIYFVPQNTDPVYYFPQTTGPVSCAPRSTNPVYCAPQTMDSVSCAPEQENPASRAPQQSDPCSDDPQQSGSGDSQQVDPGSGDSQQVDPGSGDPQQADPGSGNPQQVDPGSGDPQQVDPGSGDPQQVDPGSGDPQQADPGSLIPQQDVPRLSYALPDVPRRISEPWQETIRFSYPLPEVSRFSFSWQDTICSFSPRHGVPRFSLGSQTVTPTAKTETEVKQISPSENLQRDETSSNDSH